MARSVAFLCVGLALANVSSDLAQSQADPAGVDHRILSGNPGDRRAAVAEIVARAHDVRRVAVEQLSTIIRARPQSHDAQYFAPKALAMEALGKLRSEETIPLLLRDIEYRAAEVVDEVTPWAGMPAVRALVDIGFPSVVAILRRDTLGSASPETLRRFALVVRYVFPDAQTARAFVAAYDPGYDAAAKAKHAQLQELLAKLP